jgi:hypothetical protein
MGGHVATLGHRYEMSLAKGLAGDVVENVWIGLRWNRESTAWKWIDGTQLAHADWAGPTTARRTPPDNVAAVLSVDDNLSWATSSASLHNHFICEWDGIAMPPETVVLYDGERRRGDGGRTDDENNRLREQSTQVHEGASALEWSCSSTKWEYTWWRWVDHNATGRKTQMGRFRTLRFWVRYVGDETPPSLSVAVSGEPAEQTGSSRAEIPASALDGSWHKVEIPTMTFVRYADDENRSRDALFDPNRVRIFHIGVWSRSRISFRLYIDDMAFVN